jgi:hypothetical protein
MCGRRRARSCLNLVESFRLPSPAVYAGPSEQPPEARKSAVAPKLLDASSPRLISKQGPIDGTALVKHTIAPNLGVSVSRSYEVNRLDTDRFGEG